MLFSLAGWILYSSACKEKKYLSNSCSWFTTLLRESWLTGRSVISVQFWGLYSDYLNLNSCCCSMKLQRVSDQNTTVTSWSSMNQPGQSGHLGHVCSLFRVRTKHREAASQKNCQSTPSWRLMCSHPPLTESAFRSGQTLTLCFSRMVVMGALTTWYGATGNNKHTTWAWRTHLMISMMRETKSFIWPIALCQQELIGLFCFVSAETCQECSLSRYLLASHSLWACVF